MPESIRNPRTGLFRCQPPRNTPRKRRNPSLYSKKRLILQFIYERIQTTMESIVYASFILFACLACSYQLQLANGNENDLNLLQAIIKAILDFLSRSDIIFQLLCLMDEQIADIPIDELLTVAFHRPKQFTRIDSFISDDEAKCLTNFNKLELSILIRHFNLPPEINVPLPGGMF